MGKLDKEIHISELPLYQPELFETLLKSRPTEYHEQLFSSVDKGLSNLNAIRKYKHLLITPEIRDKYLNKSEYEGTMALNESYLLLDDYILEATIDSITYRIDNAYNLNQIYKDEESLEVFDKNIKEKSKKKKGKLLEKIEKLREKMKEEELIFDQKFDIKNVKTNQNLEEKPKEAEVKKTTLQMNDELSTLENELKELEYPSKEELNYKKNLKF